MNAEQLATLIRDENRRWLGPRNGCGHFTTNPGGEPAPDRRYGWWDGPWPIDENRPKRRPFEQLLIELAERTGRPIIPVTRVMASEHGRATANGQRERRAS